MEQGNVHINDNTFTSLLAISEKEQEHGLMYQPWPPPIMSFIYASPKVSRFWMKNTPSPLDIVFSCDGKITQIHKGEPYSTSVIGDHSVSDLIVEFPHGTVKDYSIKIGQSIGLLKPNRKELKKIFAEKYHIFIK